MKKVLVLLILLLAPIVPNNFNLIMRDYGKIVMLIAPDLRSTGTGFHFVKSDGTVIMLSNKHVCDKNQTMFATFGEYAREVRVVKVSDKTDLCMLEPIFDNGIKSAAPFRDNMPAVFAGYGASSTISSRLVHKLGFHYLPMCTESEPFRGCTNAEIMRTIAVNNLAIGGHSGSPVIDIFGNLVGVVFAANTKIDTTFIVPIEDVLEFINE
jgi:S1-C subfamily serine protease